MRFEPESQHGANVCLNVARDLLETVKKNILRQSLDPFRCSFPPGDGWSPYLLES